MIALRSLARDAIVSSHALPGDLTATTVYTASDEGTVTEWDTRDGVATDKLPPLACDGHVVRGLSC